MTGAVQVAAGYHHGCAVVNAGGGSEVYCWGENLSGELGTGAVSGWELTSRVVGLP